MKSSQAFWLSATVGRSLASAYLLFEVCPWTPLQALDLVSLPPPAADHGNLNNTRQTPPPDHQSHGTANHAWVGPHYCVGGFCVWTNTKFMGRGTSIVTTRENYQRVLDRSASAASINNDALPFNTTRVPGKGIGMVATRKIRRGEQILAAPTALMVNRRLIDELKPEDQHRLLEIAVTGLPRERSHQFMGQVASLGGHVIEDIMFTNSFQINLGQDDGHHFGNFPEVSRYNHDCRPNVAFYIDNDLTHYTHAIRDIEPGEELAISYLDSFRSRAVRQTRTMASWGFSCRCSQCSLPQGEVEASDARLYSIYQVENQLSDFHNPHRNVTPSMVEELIDLYKEERLQFKLADAYTIAALSYNLFGMKKEAVKYAELSIEQGLIQHGPNAPDIEVMRGLVREPEAHWTFNLQPYKEEL